MNGEIREQSKKNCTCMKCKENFIYDEKETWWDLKGFTDTKLVRCRYCGCPIVIKYHEDRNLDVNMDKRYYE